MTGPINAWTESKIHVPFLLAFISLLDNYEADRGQPEVITPEEENEIHSFLDALMETRVLQVGLGEGYGVKQPGERGHKSRGK